MNSTGECAREGRGRLHNFTETHIDETMKGIEEQTFDDALLFNCVFDKLTGVTMKNCDLNQSSFTTERIEDLLGFTVTLDCKSFANVELSPLIFDLIVVLLIKTRGNTSKRKDLIRLLGEDRLRELLTQMATLER